MVEALLLGSLVRGLPCSVGFSRMGKWKENSIWLTLAERKPHQGSVEDKSAAPRHERNLVVVAQFLCQRLGSDYATKTTT